jgi:hypothetical protein
MALARTCLALLAAVLLLGTAAQSSTGNGLSGIVKKGPITPVCRVGTPCDAPAQATLRFSRSTSSGTKLYAVRSKANGAYRIALPSGYYTVTTKERIGVDRNLRPRRVHVRGGHWDRVNFFIDTGIR